MTKTKLLRFEPLSQVDAALFPGKPWRVMVRVVRPDGTPTDLDVIRYCTDEAEAEKFATTLDEITDDAVQRAAEAIEQGYVDIGEFADDEYRAVTDKDREIARKALEAARGVK